MEITVHHQPLAEQIYVFPPGCSYDQRSPHILTMDATYSHQGTQCYLSNIKGEFTRAIWVALAKAFSRRGVIQIDYEHSGKELSVDLLNMSQKTERMRQYRNENREMYSQD